MKHTSDPKPHPKNALSSMVRRADEAMNVAIALQPMNASFLMVFTPAPVVTVVISLQPWDASSSISSKSG